MTTLILGALLLTASPQADPLPAPRHAHFDPRPPIYATSYNWQFSGVNCDVDCSQTASGLFTRPEMLGKTAACPAAWVGLPEYGSGQDRHRVTRWQTTLVSFPGTDIEPRYCVDVFGAERNRRLVWLSYSDVRPTSGGHYVWRVDFAEADPGAFDHNQRLLPFWRTETVDVPREWYEDEFRMVAQ